MTLNEFIKLKKVLVNKFSLNEADAISRVITDKNAPCDKMDRLLILIDSNNLVNIDNYDELIDNY